VISNAELCAGVRRLRGDDVVPVRVLARAPLAGPEVGSGAHFERVTLEIAGESVAAVLKVIAPDPILVTRERRFYEELAPRLRARLPRAYATGSVAGRDDGWVLLEEFPPAQRWRPARAFDVVRAIARVHAQTLAQAPDWLPRPFARDLVAQLGHVPEGLERLEALQRRESLVRDLASPRALELARALLRVPERLRRAFADSPEAVIHRDLHPGNVWLPRGAEPILFDWEAVCAGPPIFDVTLLCQYLAIRQLRIPLRRAEIGFFVPGGPRFDQILSVYLDALDRGSAGPAPREAIASAANGAFVWEALYRLGWVASQLESHLPRLSLQLAWIPGLHELASLGDRAALYAAWRAMFADFESRAKALLG
jgi:aminoglycoside phosphotransferase (APT) family kinase protein